MPDSFAPLAMRCGLAVRLLAASLVAWVPVGAAAAVVPARIVLQDGDLPSGTGLPVDSLRDPEVESSGAVALTGTLTDGTAFVFRDDAIVYRGSQALPTVLTNLGSGVGTSPDGEFVFPVAIDGDAGLWTHAGPVGRAGTPAPGVPGAPLAAFVSAVSPHMSGDGTIHWIARLDRSGGDDVDAVALFRRGAVAPHQLQRIVGSGDVVTDADGSRTATIGNAGGLQSIVSISDNGQHYAVVISTEGADATAFVVVDGELDLGEGDPATAEADWSAFQRLSIDDHGNVLVAGTSDLPASRNGIIAYNGTRALAVGDTAGELTLIEPSTLRFAELNDAGQAMHAWSVGGIETLMFACNASALDASSIVVLAVGDTVDLDADGQGDAAVVDFNASVNVAAEALGNDGTVYVEVDLVYDDDADDVEAIIAVPVSCCGNGIVDPGEACDDGNAIETDACRSSCVAGSCGDGVVQAGAEQCDDGNDVDTDVCPSTCQLAACGDGFVQTGVDQCDDGNDDDTDACLNSCELATCGDAIVHAGVEACDDANAIQDDACLDDCTAARCGDGIVQRGVETCDDGNDIDEDACPNTCVPAACGDGIVQTQVDDDAQVEQCDDGNDDQSDGCLNNCRAAVCGDGFVQDGVEACDDGNRDDGDGCDAVCQVELPEGSTGADDGPADDGSSSGGDEGFAGSEESGGDAGSDGSEASGPSLDADDDGCACSSGSQPGGSAATMLVLGLLGLGRRRRPSRSPDRHGDGTRRRPPTTKPTSRGIAGSKRMGVLEGR